MSGARRRATVDQKEATDADRGIVRKTMNALDQAHVRDQDWPSAWPSDIAGLDISAWLRRGWWEVRHTAQAWAAGAAWQPCLMVGNGTGSVASAPTPAWSATPAPAGQQPATPMPLPAWLRVLLAFQERGRGLGLLAAGLLTA